VEVERQARRITVHSFEVIRIELPEFEFVLRCSKGTYVRTLVHDLGERLGCGGHLSELVRRRQGTFALESAVPWSALASPGAADAIRLAVVSPEVALGFLPERLLPPGASLRRAGDLLPRLPGDGTGEELVRLVLANGAVRGVGRTGEAGVRILHWFPASGPYGRGRRG
jgi:hypothetical protein